MTVNHIDRVFILVAIISAGFLYPSPALTQSVEYDSSSVYSERNDERSIAFGTQPEWMVSGAISSVDGDITESFFTNNIANALHGLLPGLTVMQTNGEPGADSPQLYSRGISTYQPGNQLLILVDGFESSFEQMNPQEIESISLLKDASATAIYGSRAANGVLLITTKRGKEGPLRLNFSSQFGFQIPQRLPEFLNSYEYANLYNEALTNDSKTALYSAEDLNLYRSGNDPYFYPDVDWYNTVLRSAAPLMRHNLNASGGSETVKYFMSLSALSNGSLYKKAGDLSDNSINAAYNRYNFRSNVDINISKRFNISLFLGGAVENKKNPNDVNTENMFNNLSKIPPNAFPVYNPNNTFGGNSLYSNPMGDLLETGFYTSNGRSLQSTIVVSQELDMIAKGLSLSAAGSFNTRFTNQSNKTKEYARYAISKDSLGSIQYTSFGQNTSLEGFEGSSDQWENIAFQSFLNYQRVINDNNQVSAIVMYNYDVYTSSWSITPFEHVGAGGRLTFANSRKYIGEFAFGYYGSENFPSTNRFGFFPAVSVAWIVSNENFLAGNGKINFLKIRSSYGLTGNDNIGGLRFMFDKYYDFTNQYHFGNDNSQWSGISEVNIANPGVTWEKQKQINIGIEASVFNRINVVVDLFQQQRYDILSKPNRTVPQFAGLPLPDINLGEVKNKGFETTIGFTSDQNRSLRYFVNASVWYAKNEIIYKAEPIQEFDYLYETGLPVNQPFLLEFDGFFDSEEEINNSADQIFTAVQPGDIRYKDQNGDNIINQLDYYPTGKSVIPEITFSLHSGFNFKGFDLRFILQGVSGRSVYLNGYYFEAFQNNGKISSYASNRWTPENKQNADYPRLSSDNNLNNFQPSSFWQKDGSFIKLRNLELGYNFAETLLNTTGISYARLFLRGMNLFSIDHINFTDPEIIQGYPAMRTLSLGFIIQY